MPCFVAIDLKSFYASVECVERGLDPLKTNLVVADLSRTEKTICLAVSPSLKAYGIGGRARLFEVVQRVREVNRQRRKAVPGGYFVGRSSHDPDVQRNPTLALDYIVAPPRMSLYLDYSARIFGIFLRHVAAEDVHVYSVDEVFIDVTHYLDTRGLTAHELAMRMMRDVLRETGITATCGIGTNLYLCKVAMDIVAKHMPPDADGVRIATLDEQSYRQQLWSHTPITDFWRVGHGIARRLASRGMLTMGDVARRSIVNEDDLYDLLGVNAELLIDHAWGWEPCTMKAIKAYRPAVNSLSSSQVLTEPYTCTKARVVADEMAENVALDMVNRGVVADKLTLSIGYEAVANTPKPADVEVVQDHYGRPTPKPSHGTVSLGRATSSSRLIINAITALFDQLADQRLMVRRITIGVYNVVPEPTSEQVAEPSGQLDLFVDYEAERMQREEQRQRDKRERNLQQAQLSIKKRFGKNAILRGINFDEGATARERNAQIGGHKA